MTQVFVNRASVYTATTGTGTITLGSAVSGHQTFGDAGVADTNTVRYLIIDDNGAWEIGTGTYTASGTTLARSVEESSNSDALLTLTGNATVSVIAAAADMTAPSAASFTLPVTLTGAAANWTISRSGNDLVFAYNGTNVVKVSTAGAITAIDNITAYGTI